MKKLKYRLTAQLAKNLLWFAVTIIGGAAAAFILYIAATIIISTFTIKYYNIIIS